MFQRKYCYAVHLCILYSKDRDSYNVTISRLHLALNAIKKTILIIFL
uniref:Uncharacterized protein n=1 Tax=uncultured Desulfobacterium sp. TaxID=201089 RepID=E1YK44_9BACT|nr:unknown protein [uncultured Desulfobacterium sp.]